MIMKSFDCKLVSQVSILCSLLIAMPAVMAGDLDGSTVEQLVSGKTLEAVHATKGFPISTYFQPDGTYRGERKSKRVNGTWHVNNQGQLCMIRAGWGGDCFVIAQEGDVWKSFKIPHNVMRGRVHISTINKVIEGNPNNY